MDSNQPAFVLGFHGCDRSVAEDILSGLCGHLSSSQNEYDWLGHGIYFWENSPTRALAYAQQQISRKRRKNKIKDPAAIGAILDLGYCLNLLDSQYVPVIQAGYQALRDWTTELGKPMPLNQPVADGGATLLRELDCAVIDMVHATRVRCGLPCFDSVRAAFVEGKPVYDTAEFYDKTHIQICVRDPSKITGYFRIIP